MNDYKNLQVWQKAIDLVVVVYSLTAKFPKEELYGLTSQIRRAVVSIPSNIAEGKMRGYEAEFKRYLLVSFASGAELETQLEISKRLPHTDKLDYLKVDSLLNEVMKMLNSLIHKLDARS